MSFSASTRVAVWKWTIEFAKRHPFGGGFEAYRQNKLTYDTVKADYALVTSQSDLDALVESLRAVNPAMHFSTDVIVGFPGETEEDFAQTRELFEACDFDMAYVFKYSIRTGTPAATMEGQVAEEVKEARNRELLAILEANSLRRTARLIGTEEEVLVEGRDRGGKRFTGRTRGNRTCVFDASPELVGRLVPLRIDRATVSTLYGSLVTSDVGA